MKIRLFPIAIVALMAFACCQNSVKTTQTAQTEAVVDAGISKEFTKGRLKVRQFHTREDMGVAAARDISNYIRELMKTKEEVNIIFASAPSQRDMFKNFLESDIEWNRINAFHMDEYIGIDPHYPGGLGQFIRENLFRHKPFKSAHYFDPMAADPQAECDRYEDLLVNRMPTDIVILGIGENGHLAYNDPHVAFFDDPLNVKIIDLDPVSRQQQVNDGAFATIEEVPVDAYTITIPFIMFTPKLYAIAPTALKANSIRNTCDGPISTDCPASILRTHKDCTLYIDDPAGALVSH